MTLDTVELVNHRIARDLDAAFPDFVREYERSLYSGVLRMVPTPADAEDVTQETFIRAYRALSDYSPQRIRELNLQGWIWTIALNLCRNAARSRSRRPRTVELDRDAFFGGPGPEALAVEAEENRRWSRLLAELSPAQRTAVVLRHVAGLTYREIAHAMQRPEGTVKADVHRGLVKLQEVLQ